MVNLKEPLNQLTEKIPLGELEKAFTKYYVKFVCPAKPIRLMVSIILRKQMNNMGDETLIEHLVQNTYL